MCASAFKSGEQRFLRSLAYSGLYVRFQSSPGYVDGGGVCRLSKGPAVMWVLSNNLNVSPCRYVVHLPIHLSFQQRSSITSCNYNMFVYRLKKSATIAHVRIQMANVCNSSLTLIIDTWALETTQYAPWVGCAFCTEATYKTLPLESR